MLKIEQLIFKYPGSEKTVLNIPHLHIPQGSFTTLIGPSGGGKSTLLKLTNGLVPHFTGGNIRGEILVNGLDPIQNGPYTMCEHVGFVFQEPENQFVVDVVEDEIAFTLENHAIPREEMQQRITHILEQLSITHLRFRKLDSLSGGEAQRVAIAAALVLQPTILVLDEPTSQLDPVAANYVLQQLVHLRDQNQLTILVAEHRVDRILPFSDQIIFVPGNDQPTFSGPLESMLPNLPYLPPVTELFLRKKVFPLPISLKDAISRRDLVNHVEQLPEKFQEPDQIFKVLLSVHDLSVIEKERTILKNINFNLHTGERLVIMGPNGAGKSTLLRSIVGLIKPTSGTIQYDSQTISGNHTAAISHQIGLLPQDPNALLFSESVQLELEHTLNNHKLPIIEEEIRHLLTQLGLENESQRYPRDLSSGERQRVALGAICITKPPLLLLDEPTRGMDMDRKQALIDLLKTWNIQGMSFILVTHDVEFAAKFASRIIFLDQGQIESDQNPQTMFKQHPTFTPQIMQLFPEKNWINLEDMGI